jgi:hypothetical protein
MYALSNGRFIARAGSTSPNGTTPSSPRAASRASFHGPTDTRAAKPGGIGRDGIYRVCVNTQRQITGYTWSTLNSSAYKKTSAGYTIPAIW